MNLGFVSEVNLPLENTNTLVSQETLIIDNQKTDDSYIVEKTDLNHWLVNNSLKTSSKRVINLSEPSDYKNIDIDSKHNSLGEQEKILANKEFVALVRELWL